MIVVEVVLMLRGAAVIKEAVAPRKARAVAVSFILLNCYGYGSCLVCERSTEEWKNRRKEAEYAKS
jgi:sulfur relay (sulfurtransferase) DsrF/TusC family protein